MQENSAETQSKSDADEDGSILSPSCRTQLTHPELSGLKNAVLELQL